MSNSQNDTTTVAVEVDYWQLAKYQLYIWEGGGIAIVNGLMVASLLYHKILRKNKEYVIAGALAFADMLNGFGKCHRKGIIFPKMQSAFGNLHFWMIPN